MLIITDDIPGSFVAEMLFNPSKQKITVLSVEDALQEAEAKEMKKRLAHNRAMGVMRARMLA